MSNAEIGKALLQPLLSIQDYLSQDVIQPDCIEQIHNNLMEGKLVIIRNAMKASFAESMHGCLNDFTNWKLHHEFSPEGFQYHHHNIYNEEDFPGGMILCNAIFKSKATRKFISELSGKSVNRTQFSASWYKPGDYSLPHTDFIRRRDWFRQVAFVWHLTRDWQSQWGGHFFWCAKNKYLPPTFNTLILFNVGEMSWHFVTPVTAEAASKRLAINGWWTTPAERYHRSQESPEESVHSSLKII